MPCNTMEIKLGIMLTEENELLTKGVGLAKIRWQVKEM